MGRHRTPVEPMLALIAEGKTPKQIAYKLGCTQQCVLERLRVYVRESGSKTLAQAVVKWWRPID